MLCAMFVTSRLVVEDGNIIHAARHLRARIGASMRPRKPLDSGNDCEPESRTPATISTARLPVIHGPMRAAPICHARIGRGVTATRKFQVSNPRKRHRDNYVCHLSAKPYAATAVRLTCSITATSSSTCAELKSPSGPLGVRSVNGDSYRSAASITPCSVR